MTITFLADTHGKHKELEKFLIGGDVLLHAGDFTERGEIREIEIFCEWYDGLDQYKDKIFIAGNHEFGVQDYTDKVKEIFAKYKNITYLEDSFIYVGEHPDLVKIYGAPWQPEFYNWAFNLPRNGWELEQKWNDIPADTDILITHGPAFGHLDMVPGRKENLGCELLAKRIEVIKPKIHVFGHIHGGAGYKFENDTHFVNAANINEKYLFTNDPITMEWIKETNEIFIH
jgi:Icc-related predicted phosphoesterase